jgi:hypothetical protein
MGEFLWNKKWGTDKICPITLTRLRPGKNAKGIPYTIMLKCRHHFWRKSLLKWLENNDSCPICRKSIRS